jgi:hypothetical protein
MWQQVTPTQCTDCWSVSLARRRHEVFSVCNICRMVWVGGCSKMNIGKRWVDDVAKRRQRCCCLCSSCCPTMQACVAHLLLSLKMGRMMMRSDPAFITLQREDLSWTRWITNEVIDSANSIFSNSPKIEPLFLWVEAPLTFWAVDFTPNSSNNPSL